MKLFLPIFATTLFLISCSDNYKYDDSKPELKLDVSCYISGYPNELYLNASAKELKDAAQYYYYYWIVDEERMYNYYDIRKKVSYGEHFAKLILIDSFYDTLSRSCSISVNEPLKITLLSPIENYEALKTDTLVFQYGISGGEENAQISIYISTDETLLWEKGKTLENNFLEPPLNEQTYYWGVKAFTEQDTAFSEIRSVWIKN